MADISKPIYGTVWAETGEKLAPIEAKMQSGWVQEMMPYQYENFLQNRQDIALTYLFQKGIPEWSIEQEYIANKSVVTYAGQMYMALLTNTNTLPTVSTSWKKLTINFAPNGAVPVTSGGTGATSAADARTNLGLGTAATVSADTVVFKSVTGNAPAADKWTSPISVSLSGGAVGSALVDGSSNAIINVTGLNASSISSGTVPSSALTNATLKTSSTGSTILAAGFTSERDLAPQEGYSRWNKTTKVVEVFNGTSWTVNTSQSEAYLLNRANHTGEQAITTVTGLATKLATKVEMTSATGAAILPEGTEAERPESIPTSGLLLRLNKSTGTPEWYDRVNTAWTAIGDSKGELFDYSWHNGPRSSIDAGCVPCDGQVIQFADNPVVCQAVWDGKQNAVSEANWAANKNCWGRGDGATWVRVPNLNMADGSAKPFYLRGGPDALNGTSVGDAIRNITGSMVGLDMNASTAAGAFAKSGGSSGQTVNSGSFVSTDRTTTFDASRVVPVADENRVKTAYGVWTVRVFTEVSNVGALDAGQLATQLAVVDAKVQTLEAATGFTIIYPNGGSAASPANIALNSTYSMPNPFPGRLVECEVQVLYAGVWSAPRWYSNVNGSIGAYANHAVRSDNATAEEIVVTTGSAGTIPRSSWGGNAFRLAADLTVAVPARVIVRVKGST